MALSIPIVSGVIPIPNDTDVALKPTIQILFGGAQLIDPLTWDNRTFALYGPGDVVLDSGPGTILNSGLEDAAYPLLDGPLRRDRIEGSFSLAISGTSGLDMAESMIGSGQPYTLARFTPTVPLNPNTEYTAILLGDDASGQITPVDRRFEGITSYTSPSGFILSGVGTTSGFIKIVRPYSRTLETSLFSPSTGLNDIYTITITSGTGIHGFKYDWFKASSFGTFSEIVSGATDRHDLGDGLLIDFIGAFNLGEVHQLNVYIPQPLPSSIVWSFSTGDVLQYASPPEEPECVSLIIDNTTGGGLVIDTTTSGASNALLIVDSDPGNLDYEVSPSLSFILLEFNEELVSGNYDVSNVEITTTPILGISGSTTPEVVIPTSLETSGKFLRIIL